MIMEKIISKLKKMIREKNLLKKHLPGKIFAKQKEIYCPQAQKLF